jgi:hypothetical protein
MKRCHIVRSKPCLSKAALLFGLVLTASLVPLARTTTASTVVLWDTHSPVAKPVESQSRAEWTVVPSDLFALEKEPPKASSDPGYYGREYAFQGDAVVENNYLMAVFSSAQGRVLIYSKVSIAGAGLEVNPKLIGELFPLPGQLPVAGITRSELVRNSGDEVALETFFSVAGSTEKSVLFSLGKSEVLEIKPGKNMPALRLRSPMAYGVVPSFIGDDLIFGGKEFASEAKLWVPAENFFLGLLKGEERVLVMTWPKGKQRMSLALDHEESKDGVESIDFWNDGQSFYLAPLVAPGIWHKEELGPSYLEKDMMSHWKRPFPARWKTELSEAGVRTSFSFREAKGQIWRGVPGSYIYPVWFDGENAAYHLSKKVPAEGDSLIYFLEGNNTPATVSTPVDILNATLGRPAAASILDPFGRKLRTHHRRAGVGVRRACTCGCTEAIQAVFEAGQEVSRKDDIQADVADMVYFVQRHVGRIDEYRRFADAMIQLLHAESASVPDLKPFVESLEQVVEKIPQEYEVQKENMKSLDYAAELNRKTMALTGKKDAQNLPAYMELLKDWRAMGGAQDYVVAQCNVIARKLFQEAGYGCIHDPKAVVLAEKVRQRCREVLRNPDGYEIWPNY